MCGICGTFPYGSGKPVGEPTLDEMLSCIRHRGPDDKGTYVTRNVALGSRRLSIIDLTGGNQPIFNEDGSIVLVFNGEIYNYRELRSRLHARGHTFRTGSDTEVIVHLYEDKGDDCVLDLRGMFAFALWDARRRRLLVARDRLGIKPLYYWDRGGLLAFGSEIKALLRHPAVEARANLEGLGHFLSLKYVPAPQTMFDGIHALPPGHLLTCDARGPKVRSYWRLSFANRAHESRSGESYAEELSALLREAVALHLVSDVPFGAFLSGGLDSSTIVALMSEVLPTPTKTFSVGFDGAGAMVSELPWARRVAQRFGTDHHEVVVDGRDLAARSERVVWHLDQPIGDPATLANYMVAELAGRHVKMVLTGEGGDELFAGYARHAGDKLSPLFRYAPRSAKSLALACASRLPGLGRPRLALYALCQPDETSRLVNWFPLFNPEMKSALLTDEVKRLLNGTSAADVFARCLAQTDATDPLSRMLHLDTTLWLPDDLLARGDKTSMAASVEARVPLLDHKVVEFAAALPSHLKVHGLTRKYLLKKVARRWLPPEIVHRKKQGFPVPLSVWFRAEAREFVRDLLSSDAVRRRGLFNPRYVQSLIDRNERGDASCGPQLWALVNVELWYRLFIDRSGSPDASRRWTSDETSSTTPICAA
ncbi:MAG TPA: asparagine synthase (glutamine-hydrolyzing) [Vicinamibacterales bacterium]|jgi:asparagine synthase (glutamine-hydrolysing)